MRRGRRVQLGVQRAEVADKVGGEAAQPSSGEKPRDRAVARGERAERGEGAAPLDECERAVNANYSEARAAERLVSKPITRRLKLVGTYVSG